jgi:hypothetical protein
MKLEGLLVNETALPLKEGERVLLGGGMRAVVLPERL